MNPLELSVTQLKRAAALKQRIEALNNQLRTILGSSASTASLPKKKRPMSAAVKKRIAAAQRARWAKIKAGQPARAAARPKKAAAGGKNK